MPRTTRCAKKPTIDDQPKTPDHVDRKHARFDKFQKMSFMQIPDHATELIKFSLSTNNKTPVEKFGNLEKSDNCVKYDNSNVGLRTGFMTDITIIDVDMYKMDHSSIFLKTFKEDIEASFNTFTVRTANNGRHYYFKYDSDIKQSQGRLSEDGNHTAFNVDIRNDGGFVVCPPS
jgi:hypothetical protein